MKNILSKIEKPLTLIELVPFVSPKDVPKEHLTEDVCLAFVKHNVLNFYLLPEEVITDEVWLLALELSPEIISSFERMNPSLAVIEKSINKTPEILKSFLDLPEYFYLKLVEERKELIQFVEPMERRQEIIKVIGSRDACKELTQKLNAFRK